MSPTDFEFTVTLPGDSRLIGTVRQLAAQAAGYAELPADDGEGLAHQVERATEMAMGSSALPHAPVHIRFSGDARRIEVVISWDAASPTTPPPSSVRDGVTVDWTAEGSRRQCHIRRPLPA